MEKKNGACLEVFWAFLRLGLTSFGGPVAHLSYFRAEFVERRQWLDEASYADLVALCQFLPGPASSQVGFALGLRRAGLCGGFVAWTAFTLPSALALVAFAYGLSGLGDLARQPWLHGLKIVALAVVAQAVWTMAKNLCPDRIRATLAVCAAALVLALPSAGGQIAAIAAGGLFGLFFLAGPAAPAPALRIEGHRGALAAALAFLALLFGLPLAAAATQSHGVALFASFYRAGALVFGGGHVVLPLLQQAVVPPGWIDNSVFLAGYGAAQAVPGPLFAFAAFLGAAMREAPNGAAGALLCLVAIYLPSFLLVLAVLPFWRALRARPKAQGALKGVNAAVVGLLLAALYNPVWTSAIFSPSDFALAVLAFLLLAAWKVPPWAVVILGAIGATFAASI
ncbi:chromate efflux transporter [Rhodoblastus acidophilus]|uniref:Chromate efflux transporter n=1 Tax=Candidatus Rhodoblastus alkanivorans TaxID=2954117 RepID=A0ABS9Z7F8_9HYPH|nr:chromate efflux transporter [Candidatus Rhodoblastus alkanivorans]MCI4679136.1 chromate efflux transporter [Candidatus Rhodoblastus alkanivorans]MCI4683132.1 chromate efflux transporter [Candidatus Rhodoblastus alkanivorans]MDI4640443.1 chromate efflux transporter [Rhodoblastus acidophilus]